jgi:hypothetical protein
MDKNVLVAIIAEAKQAAVAAAQAYVDNWKSLTGGNQYGEPMYCGFAHTSIKQFNGKEIDGRTKIGRMFKAAGVEQGHTGRFELHNPANWNGQSMEVKKAGAKAAAQVFESHGFTANASARGD